MIEKVEENLTGVSELCRKYGVLRMDLFGSAARGDFRPGESDIDVLVKFDMSRFNAFRDLFGLAKELEELFGCPVDVTTVGSLKHPSFIRNVNASKELLYAA